eukprot:4148987-Amphidinium_carterae.1
MKRAQRFFVDDLDPVAEHDEFWSTLRAVLPVTVRVDSQQRNAASIEDRLALKGWSPEVACQFGRLKTMTMWRHPSSRGTTLDDHFPTGDAEEPVKD